MLALNWLAAWFLFAKPFTVQHKPDPLVVLPDSALEQSRPRPPKGIVEKATKTIVDAEQIATSKGKPGRAAVLSYCRPSLAEAEPLPEFGKNRGSAIPLSAPVSRDTETLDTIPPTQPPFAGSVKDGRLTLHSTLSDGTLWRGSWRVHEPFTWSSSGDSVWVVQDRLWVRIGRGAVKCGKRAAIGGAVGGVVGAILGDWQAGSAAGGFVGCTSVFD